MLEDLFRDFISRIEISERDAANRFDWIAGMSYICNVIALVSVIVAYAVAWILLTKALLLGGDGLAWFVIKGGYMMLAAWGVYYWGKAVAGRISNIVDAHVQIEQQRTEIKRRKLNEL